MSQNNTLDRLLAPTLQDARGIFITWDLIDSKSDFSAEDSMDFWGSSQFYVNGDVDQMAQHLATIHYHDFYCIPSLCLDFGWNIPHCDGFLQYEKRYGRDPLVLADRRPSPHLYESLFSEILRRGNAKLELKVLWTTSLSLSVEDSPPGGEDEMESP